MLAFVWIFTAVLENGVFLKLQLPTKSLVALTASLRKQLDVMRAIMPVHIVFVGEHLVTVAMFASDRCYLRFGSMAGLLVALKMRIVCVFFRATVNVASKLFL